MIDSTQFEHKTVFAFDRDGTVSTSCGAVPLECVQTLAELFPVYATGNQMLKEEAGIPGVSEIIAEKGADAEEDLRTHLAGAGRRERLHMLAELYPEYRKIVVDDVDLSDMEEWEYYFPDDFVAAFLSSETARSREHSSFNFLTSTQPQTMASSFHCLLEEISVTFHTENIEQVCIYGAGKTGQLLYGLLSCLNVDVTGVFDDYHSNPLGNHPVSGGLDACPQDVLVLVAISGGNPAVHDVAAELDKRGIPFRVFG